MITICQKCAALQSAVARVVQNHALTVANAHAPLTDEDTALGNTEEWQSGFRAALEMVTADYIVPLVNAYNDSVKGDSQ